MVPLLIVGVVAALALILLCLSLRIVQQYAGQAPQGLSNRKPVAAGVTLVDTR